MQKEIKVTQYQCERCKHTWLPKAGKTPKVCPKCKTPYWNSPVTKKKKVDAILYPYGNAPVEMTATGANLLLESINKMVKELYTKVNKLEQVNKVTILPPATMPESLIPPDPRIIIETTPPMPDKDTSEISVNCFNCAKSHRFECDFYNKQTPDKMLCTDCFKQEFWYKKEDYKVMFEFKELDEPGEQQIAVDEFAVKALNCKERTYTSEIPFCRFKFNGTIHNNYCTYCWESIKIWGNQAAGYEQQMSKQQ